MYYYYRRTKVVEGNTQVRIATFYNTRYVTNALHTTCVAPNKASRGRGEMGRTPHQGRMHERGHLPAKDKKR